MSGGERRERQGGRGIITCCCCHTAASISTTVWTQRCLLECFPTSTFPSLCLSLSSRLPSFLLFKQLWKVFSPFFLVFLSVAEEGTRKGRGTGKGGGGEGEAGGWRWSFQQHPENHLTHALTAAAAAVATAALVAFASRLLHRPAWITTRPVSMLNHFSFSPFVHLVSCHSLSFLLIRFPLLLHTFTGSEAFVEESAKQQQEQELMKPVALAS